MVTGRTALVGCATLFTIGCAPPMAERPPSAEPERTYVGPRDERPRPTLAPIAAAPATDCPVGPDAPKGARLAELSLFSRTLFLVREDYPREITSRSRQLLLAALAAIPAAESVVAVEKAPDATPPWATVTVKGERCTLNLERVDTLGGLLSSLQDGMRFIGSRLAPPDEETEARFTKIEMAATNAMLAVLDRQSSVMDADTYAKVRENPPGLSATAVLNSRENDLRPAAFAGPHAGEVAYLSLDGFQRGAGAEVQQASLGSGGQPPKGVILDLRHNKGGPLDEAARVADVFIERGVLGWIVGRRERTALEAHDRGQDFAGAVVVLVSHETAAAAELVASAIQNLGRGVIIGEATAGAGSVRAFFDLPKKWRPPTAASPPAPPDSGAGYPGILDGAEPSPPRHDPEPAAGEPTEVLGLLLRTGYLRTANDHPLEGSGVRPDVELPRSASPASASGDACLIQMAQALISQAPDGRRSTLLALAKGLTNARDCAQAP